MKSAYLILIKIINIIYIIDTKTKFRVGQGLNPPMGLTRLSPGGLNGFNETRVLRVLRV